MSDPNDPTPNDNISTAPTLTSSGSRKGGRSRTTAIAAGVVGVALIGGVAWWALGSGGDSADADAGSTIDVALQLFPDNLDIRTTSGAALDQTLIDNVYEGLVSRDAAGEVSPSLASEWTVSDDKLTYTFTLHDDLTFSNGDALTSEDVVWSLTDVTTNELVDAATLGSVSSVTADGDDTVVVQLSQPDPSLLYSLAGRGGLVLDSEATNDLKTTAVGSGPFTVESFKAGETLTLATNDEYWGDAPEIDGVVFRLFDDVNAILNAVNEGTVDVAGIDPTLADEVDSENYDVSAGFASDKYTLAFNNAAAPLNDVRVRQAIRHAIDHDAFVDAREGKAKILGGPIVESDPGYADLTDLYPFDQEKARQLLADAGYPNGLELTVTTPAFYGTTTTDILTSQLAEVGITLTVEAVEFPTWLNDVYTNKDYQLSIVDHAEARDFANWANPDYYFGYDNPEVQSLFTQASTATSEEAQAELLEQAAQIVSQDAAGDWLFNPTLLTAVRKGVDGVPTDSTSARLDLTSVSVD